MRPVERGAWPVDVSGARVVFAKYGEAQPGLIERIGRYCSYCEMRLDNLPAVEHVSPKKRDPERERDWENLLLACAYCNSHKSNRPKPSLLSEHCWPDRDNTFHAFRYLESGEVEIDRNRSDAQQALAMRTRALVSLNNRPEEGTHVDVGDPRWRKRIAIWGIAADAREDLAERDTPRLRESIVRNAYELGCWSIWMTVFASDVDMRRRLIVGFHGTALSCFDESCEPCPRPGGAL